jgi:hypothetical protein
MAACDKHAIIHVSAISLGPTCRITLAGHESAGLPSGLRAEIPLRNSTKPFRFRLFPAHSSVPRWSTIYNEKITVVMRRARYLIPPFYYVDDRTTGVNSYSTIPLSPSSTYRETHNFFSLRNCGYLPTHGPGYIYRALYNLNIILCYFAIRKIYIIFKAHARDITSQTHGNSMERKDELLPCR